MLHYSGEDSIWVAAMFKEYKQLVNMEVFGCINPDTLTIEQNARALHAINLIKEKLSGRIKGRTCADGRPQKGWITKQESSLSIVMLDGFLATLIVDAYKGQAIQTFDVPFAFLQMDILKNKTVIIKIKGKFLDIMKDVNPELAEDVRYKGKTKVLNLKYLKAIYGLVESALLWYQLYTVTLKDMGFELNPFN